MYMCTRSLTHTIEQILYAIHVAFLVVDDASQELLLITWPKTVDKFQFNYIVSHKFMQTQERRRTQMNRVNKNVSFRV